MKCEICGNEAGNRTHQVREMMLGFEILLPISNARVAAVFSCGRFPKPFHLLSPRLFILARTALFSGEANTPKTTSPRSSQEYACGEQADSCVPRRPDIRAVSKIRPRKSARILWMLDAALGYWCGICGCRDSRSGRHRSLLRNALVRKQTLDEVEGKWDVIMMHHSFEHMPAPRTVLQKIESLLAEGGTCLIRIPVKNEAWKLYGANWSQLDAPRHFFIHTFRSIKLLASQAGLGVSSYHCDSDEFQFWLSELYQKDISAVEAIKNGPRHYFSDKALKGFRQRARELNAEKLGDAAVFYLSRLPKQSSQVVA